MTITRECDCRGLWEELLRADDVRQNALNGWTIREDESQEVAYVKAARYVRAIRLRVARARDRHPACFAPFAVVAR